MKAEGVPMITAVYTGGYEQVWTELKRRYDNPRRLVETHVNRLIDLPETPSDSQRTLQNVVDYVRNTTRALSVMHLPVDQWDAILYPIVLRKLPSAARQQWAMSLHESS